MDKAFKDSFFAGYVECALWSETDESDPETGGAPLDENYGEEDIAPEALAEMRKDCDNFCDENAGMLKEAADAHGRPADHLGHDFMLSRNGHGTGFWDRGLGHIGDDLHKAAKVYGTQGLYVGDDSLIYTHG
jgi:hypothetical protein